MFGQFIAQYGMEILYALVLAVAGCIGTAIKNIYKKHVDDQTKEKVVKTVVKAVKQLYSDMDGEQKLEIAIDNVTEMLAEKGITITELEVRMLIEAAVEEMKEKSGFTIFEDTEEMAVD